MHNQGLAHWDIKPHNVLLATADATPILMDLGSACPAVKEVKCVGFGFVWVFLVGGAMAGGGSGGVEGVGPPPTSLFVRSNPHAGARIKLTQSLSKIHTKNDDDDKGTAAPRCCWRRRRPPSARLPTGRRS